MRDDGEELQVEATGETVGEAKWQALRQLESLASDVDRGSVRFQVLSEGERGLLGVGYSPARVVATAGRRAHRREADEPVPESSAASLAGDVVSQITSALGVDCRVQVIETAESVVVSCVGPELGIVIGRHGQTIDAIQYLVNAIVMRSDEPKEVVVDASGYRARREATLHSLAVQSAERAVSEGAAVELEPMSAVERKVVHLRLKDYPGVETTSQGTEPNRYVVVSPAAENG